MVLHFPYCSYHTQLAKYTRLFLDLKKAFNATFFYYKYMNMASELSPQ